MFRGKIHWKGLLVSLLFGFALVFAEVSAISAAQTCPDGGGWTKINSGDLGLYPVDGATEYCFKAGTEVYDDLESWKSSGKDLSHWSYYLSERTSTPVPTTEATETPTSTQEPTITPGPTNTPDPTRTPGVTTTPEPTNTRTPPPGSTPTYTATPGRTSTGTPTSTPWIATPSPSPSPRTPCPCVETSIVQDVGIEHDHIALWAAITLLAGTNGAWMIKRRKLGK